MSVVCAGKLIWVLSLDIIYLLYIELISLPPNSSRDEVHSSSQVQLPLPQDQDDLEDKRYDTFAANV